MLFFRFLVLFFFLFMPLTGWSETFEAPSKSLKELNQAISKNPGDADAYYERGMLHARSGRIDKSIMDFDKAIELNPKHAHAYYYRGRAYAKKEEHGTAIKNFDSVIELNPSFPKAYYNRGLSHALSGQTEKAIEDLRKSCDMGYIISCKKLKSLTGRKLKAK